MVICHLNLQDGYGIVPVAVCDVVTADRLTRYFKETEKLLDEFEELKEKLMGSCNE